MKRWHMFCGVWSLVLVCCLGGCSGCFVPIQETFADLVVEPSTLSFDDSPSDRERSTTMFLQGSQASATIESIELKGSTAFQIISKFKTPFRIEGGKANGVKIQVGFTPDGGDFHEGRIRIVCPDCINANTIEVKLLFRKSRPTGFANLVWSCGATLDFGNVALGDFSRKRCVLTNVGSADLKIDGHQYQHKSGDANAFKWLAPMGEFVVKAGDPQGFEVDLDFAPIDPSATSSSGAFVLSTKTSMSITGSLQLNVTGNQVLPQPKIELVPKYPTCTENSTCRTIDSRLSCVKDHFSGTTMCRQPENDKPILKFPLTGKGKVSKRTFVLRNTGTSALKVDKISFDLRSSKDFKVITEGLNFPLVLEPKQEKEFTVEYTPSDNSEDTGVLVAISNAAGLPNAEMLVEASTRGCNLDVLPRMLEFSGPMSKQVTIVNVGNETCLVKRVFLKSGTSEPFQLVPPPPANQKLVPNGSFSFLVKFAPQHGAKITDFIVIESDDPDEPTIEVEVIAERVEPPRCELQATPFTLQFGLVSVGRSRKSSVTISNHGSGDCELTAINVLGTNPAGNGAFQLATAIQLPLKIAAGSNIRLDVDYTPPVERSGYEGKLEIQSNDKVQPNFEVKLVGSSGTLCLELVPPSLDFGATKFGCATSKRTIEIFNLGAAKCAASIAVNGIKLAQNTNGEFRINSAPAVPRTLAAGQSIRVELSYKAKDLGVDTATLELANDVPGQSPVSVPLVGEGVATSDQKDVFKQQSRSMVDLAFIVDNSCSMADDQASLGSNFRPFINWAVRINVDYRILVTTTDVTGADAGCAQGTTKIITPQTPSPEASFKANVNVGTVGSAQEQGLEAAYRMLTPPALTGCNKGFYRQDAVLSLIFLSDEPDVSPRPVQFYVDFLKALKGPRNLDQIRASAIVGPVPNGCTNGQVSASAAPRYWDVAKQLKGVQAPICSPWAQIMSDIGANSFTFKTQFFLSRQADPTTIVVKVNGNLIKEDAQSGWQYDSTNNSVNFASAATPAPGAAVEIVYKAVCLP